MKKRLILILIIISSISSLCFGKRGSCDKDLKIEQDIVLQKKGVLFKLELLSRSELLSTDTLRQRYTVRNESSNDIVILDINIPEKEYWNPLLINDKMEIEIDLGGNILAKMGMIRKFRILKSNTEYTAIFVLPVSQYLDKYKKWKEKMGFNWQSTFTKDVPIITSVAFSDSEEFLNGELRKATKFDDYWGMIEGWEGSGIESIVEMFKICGITLEIHLDDK